VPSACHIETDNHGAERTTTVNDTASISWDLFLKLLDELPRDSNPGRFIPLSAVWLGAVGLVE
jgi:hypothetical protein